MNCSWLGKKDSKAPSNWRFVRVEALWPDDNEWYPAQIILKEKNKSIFVIRFDGFLGEYRYSSENLREPINSGVDGETVHDHEDVDNDEWNENCEDQVDEEEPASQTLPKSHADAVPTSCSHESKQLFCDIMSEFPDLNSAPVPKNKPAPKPHRDHKKASPIESIQPTVLPCERTACTNTSDDNTYTEQLEASNSQRTRRCIKHQPQRENDEQLMLAREGMMLDLAEKEAQELQVVKQKQLQSCLQQLLMDPLVKTELCMVTSETSIAS
jgi:hypothetical protein